MIGKAKKTGEFGIMKRRLPAKAGSAVAVAVFVFLVAKPAQVLAQPLPGSTTEAEMQSALEERDERLAAQEEIIADLLRRVEELEGRMRAEPTPPPAAAAAPAAPPAEPPAPAAEPGPPAEPPPPAETVAQEEAPGEEAEEGAPGTFEVDEEAAERALERTLVQQGALLLPFGQLDLSPNFTYTRREQDETAFVFAGGGVFPADVDVDRNEFTASLETRIGMPWDTQLEFGIPLRYEETTEIVRSRFPNFERESRNGFGLGDIDVGVAATVLRERGWRPDLIARVTWDSTSGQEVNDIELGSGFNELRGSITAIKRQDPLVFIGSGFYETTFERDQIDPGDEFGFSVGAVLAASPNTSLSFRFQQSFSNEATVGGREIIGSDQHNAVLAIGASSILRRGLLLSVAGGIGLTDDAPDYFVNVSLPIRFNLPIR